MNNKEYEKFKNNLIYFLSINLSELPFWTQVKLLNNMRDQLEKHEDNRDMQEVINVGIEIVKKSINRSVDNIEVSQIRVNKSFEDWKRRKDLM